MTKSDRAAERLRGLARRAAGPDPRLEWVGRRLRRALDADRRRHVADARFGLLLGDAEAGRHAATPR